MTKALEFIPSIIDCLGSFILLAMLMVILILAGYVTLNGLWDLRSTNRNVEDTLINATKNVDPNHIDNVTGDLRPALKVYLEQLQRRSDGMLDSNTISFLFQIFAVCLVSAGVYLLSRSHKNLRAMEQNAKRLVESRRVIREFIEDGVTASVIGGLLLTALGASSGLSNVALGTAQSGSFATSVRESLHQLLHHLKKAERRKRGMDKGQRDIFLDQTKAIQENLRKTTVGQEFLTTCEECLHIFKRETFVKRYKKRYDKLTSDSISYTPSVERKDD